MADISEVRGNLRADLSSSITDADTSLTVDDEFASKTVPSDGYLAIGEQQDFTSGTYEVVRYSGFTRGSGTSTFSNLTRGLDNTSASSWNSGITIGANIPGNLLARIPQQQESLDMNSNSINNVSSIFKQVNGNQLTLPDDLSSYPNKEIYIPEGTYSENSQWNLENNTIYRGAGPGRTILDFSALGSGTYGIRAQGSEGPEYTLNSISQGAYNVTTNTASEAGNFSQGDLVRIGSTDTFLKAPSNKGELAIVEAINAGTGEVDLRWPTFDTYSTSVTISKITPIENLILKDLTIKMSSADSAQLGIFFDMVKHFSIENIQVLYGRERGIHIDNSIFGTIKNCDIRESWYDGTVTSYNLIFANASQFIDVHSNKLIRARHNIAHGGNDTIKGVPRFIINHNNYCISSGTNPDGDGTTEVPNPYCLDTHNSGEYISFINNICIGGGIKPNGQKIKVVGNRIYHPFKHGIEQANVCWHNVLSRNEIIGAQENGIEIKKDYGLIESEVDGNIIKSPSDKGIHIETGAGETSFCDNKIIDAGGIGIHFRNMGTIDTDISKENCTVRGNEVMNSGSYGILWGSGSGYDYCLVSDNLSRNNGDTNLHTSYLGSNSIITDNIAS